MTKNPRSFVRTLMLRELAKGPRTTAQLAEITGASVNHLYVYLKEAGAIKTSAVRLTTQGRPPHVWALPKIYGTTVDPTGT